MTNVQDRLAALSPEQRALLQQRLKGARNTVQAAAPAARPAATGAARGLGFGLFYFSADASNAGSEAYGLLLEGARFADEHGFKAVWTPERHFHAFGGLYPSPAVVAGALALATRNVQLRAGSVVLPLHHPARVAEDWAVVDNLSGGRAGIALASGWHTQDFTFNPTAYADRKARVAEALGTLRRLWAGEAVRFEAAGGPVELRTFPRPVQRELPVWITAAVSPETFAQAGALGANVLTSMLDLTVEQLAERIQIYRDARARHGHDREAGEVAVMAHTYVGESEAEVRATVSEPFFAYLKSHGELGKGLARAAGMGELTRLSEADERALLQFGLEKYLSGQSMLGTVEQCQAVAERLAAVGVAEVACLIDFGVPRPKVLEGLQRLANVLTRCHAEPAEAAR